MHHATFERNYIVMKRTVILIWTCLIILFVIACNQDQQIEESETDMENEYSIEKEDINEMEKDDELTIEEIDQKQESEQLDFTLFDREPKEWGENVTGVYTTFQTGKKEVALTF